MKLFIFCLCLLLLAGDLVFAGGKRKKAPNPNDTTPNSQPQPSPDQPAPPSETTPSPPAAPIDPALATTQKNIADLRANIAALNQCTKSTVDSDLRASLLNNLTAAAQGTKPAQESIQQLADDLVGATLGRNQMQPLTLARDIHAAFNSSHLADTQLQAVLDQVRSVLGDSDVPAKAIAAVNSDLRRIASETK